MQRAWEAAFVVFKAASPVAGMGLADGDLSGSPLSTLNPEEPGGGTEPSAAPEQPLSQVFGCGNGSLWLLSSHGEASPRSSSRQEGRRPFSDVAFQWEDLGRPGGFAKMSLKKNRFSNL